MPFHITLLGIGTLPVNATIKADRKTFAISFKPLASEYLLKERVADLVNKAKNLPANFWNSNLSDLLDFELFCQKATQTIKSLVPKEIDGIDDFYEQIKDKGWKPTEPN